MHENSESMHSMGTSKKRNFDPLISGCESVGNMLSDTFSDSDNERAVKDHKCDEEMIQVSQMSS